MSQWSFERASKPTHRKRREMPRESNEYPALSELIKRSNRNLFATAELEAEPNKNTAIHYSYNLTRNEADGTELPSGGSYANTRERGRRQTLSTDHRWRLSRNNMKPNKREDASEKHVGGKKNEGVDFSDKMWSSALSRDSKFYYSRQLSETWEQHNDRWKSPVRKAPTRHNSLPGERLLSHGGGQRTEPRGKRRKWGICDDTDGAHYQRQFLRVLKKRF